MVRKVLGLALAAAICLVAAAGCQDSSAINPKVKEGGPPVPNFKRLKASGPPAGGAPSGPVAPKGRPAKPTGGKPSGI
jgi:hypothetical protein